jgi:hypothetical protein
MSADLADRLREIMRSTPRGTIDVRRDRSADNDGRSRRSGVAAEPLTSLTRSDTRSGPVARPMKSSPSGQELSGDAVAVVAPLRPVTPATTPATPATSAEHQHAEPHDFNGVAGEIENPQLDHAPKDRLDGAGPDDWTNDDDLGRFEERAAIVEFDGSIPRAWADGYAHLDLAHPPAEVPSERWRQFVDDVGRFLDGPFCAVAVNLGWTAHDLFGADRLRPWARVDRMGLLWLVNGGRIEILTDNSATITRQGGARQTFRRVTVGHGCILAWELEAE